MADATRTIETILTAKNTTGGAWKSAEAGGKRFFTRMTAGAKVAATAFLNMRNIIAGGIIAGASAGIASAALGVTLMLYAGLGLSPLRPRVPAGAEPWLSPVVGLLTGVVSAGTGIFVMPSVPYLQALGLEKDDLVQALGITFLVATVALGFGLFSQGVLAGGTALTSLAMLAPALVGMWLGQVVRARISAAAFRMWFMIGLLVLGAHLALKPLM